MLRLHSIACTILASSPLWYSGAACGQNYPLKPVRVVTSSVGAAPDFIIRLVAPELTASLGHTVFVENRGGGGGATAAEAVARAQPDGYTLLSYGNTLWIAPLLGKTGYDPERDFAPIALLSRQPNVLVVHPSLPVKTVKDLIALAKTKPGMLNYGSGETGSSNHLAAELFKSMAGVDLVRVNYKGAGPAVTATIAGEVQVMLPTAGSSMRHVKSGRLIALAVTTTEPSALAPGLPTVSAAGLPGYESVATAGLFAPARTPAAIVNRLQQEMARVLDRAAVKQRLFDAGIEGVGSTPELLTTTMKSEMTRLGKVIREAGINAD